MFPDDLVGETFEIDGRKGMDKKEEVNVLEYFFYRDKPFNGTHADDGLKKVIHKE